MDSGVVRDFVISISGGLILILFILMFILGFILYRQIKALTNSIKETTNTAKEMGAEVKEAFKSASLLSSIFKDRTTKNESSKVNEKV